jgi:hypothetical protein
MTFSVEDHGMVCASSALVQAFVCPQEISINFDHLAAIRSALELAPLILIGPESHWVGIFGATVNRRKSTREG